MIIRDRITGRTFVPKNIQPGDKIVTYIAGVTFNNHQTLIRDLNENSDIYLIREPQNVYDPNAIRVVVRTNDEFSFEEIMKLSKDCIDENCIANIGYIPKDLASKIASIFNIYSFYNAHEYVEMTNKQFLEKENIYSLTISFRLHNKDLFLLDAKIYEELKNPRLYY